jgi:hypothetical protein
VDRHEWQPHTVPCRNRPASACGQPASWLIPLPPSHITPESRTPSHSHSPQNSSFYPYPRPVESIILMTRAEINRLTKQREKVPWLRFYKPLAEPPASGPSIWIRGQLVYKNQETGLVHVSSGRRPRRPLWVHWQSQTGVRPGQGVRPISICVSDFRVRTPDRFQDFCGPVERVPGGASFLPEDIAGKLKLAPPRQSDRGPR